jgi:hypothetical protein
MPPPPSPPRSPRGSDTDVAFDWLPTADPRGHILAWDGRTFDYVTVCGSARCAEAVTAPAGVYHLTVPLFDRPVTPDSGVAPVRTVEAAFQISSGGTGDTDIEIPIGL